VLRQFVTVVAYCSSLLYDNPAFFFVRHIFFAIFLLLSKEVLSCEFRAHSRITEYEF
jgi:hypothetical protein